MFLKEVLKNLILKKKSANDNKSIKNYPACKKLFTCRLIEIATDEQNVLKRDCFYNIDMVF